MSADLELTRYDIRWRGEIQKAFVAIERKVSGLNLGSKLWTYLKSNWEVGDSTDRPLVEILDLIEPDEISRQNYGEGNIATTLHELRTRKLQQWRRENPHAVIDISVENHVLKVRRKPASDNQSSIPGQNIIAFGISNPSEWHTGKLVLGAEKVCRENGFYLLAFGFDNDTARERDWLEKVRSRQFLPGGLMIIPVEEHDPHGAYKELVRSRIPVLFVDRHISEFAEILPRVSSDNRTGAALATRFLIEQKKCRRVVAISEDVVSSLAERRRGYNDALEQGKKNNPEFDERPKFCAAHRREPNGGFAWGYSETQKLLCEKDALGRGVGIFALSDNVAAGCRAALMEAGRTNEDNPLVGFDGQIWCGFLDPPLETIQQDFERMGAIAASRLIDLIQGPPPPRVTQLDVFLVEASTWIQRRSQEEKSRTVAELLDLQGLRSSTDTFKSSV